MNGIRRTAITINFKDFKIEQQLEIVFDCLFLKSVAHKLHQTWMSYLIKHKIDDHFRSSKKIDRKSDIRKESLVNYLEALT
jgi:hypothetical protein